MSWEDALKKFTDRYAEMDDVRAILLAGSYAVGCQSRNSDIDVHIITSYENNWRERGNLIIDGYLIEYFVNPLKYHYRYIREDLLSNSHTNARMFATGQVLMDKDGLLNEFIAYSRRVMEKDFSKPSGSEVEIWKYSLWDRFDNLKDPLRMPRDNFRLSFSLLLSDVLEKYCRFLGVEIPPDSRAVSYFTDSRFRNSYHYRKFPDGMFTEKFMNCLQDGSVSSMEKLVSYTLSAMGGFEIDGWKIRSKMDAEENNVE